MIKFFSILMLVAGSLYGEQLTIEMPFSGYLPTLSYEDQIRILDQENHVIVEGTKLDFVTWDSTFDLGPGAYTVQSISRMQDSAGYKDVLADTLTFSLGRGEKKTVYIYFFHNYGPQSYRLNDKISYEPNRTYMRIALTNPLVPFLYQVSSGNELLKILPDRSNVPAYSWNNVLQIENNYTCMRDLIKYSAAVPKGNQGIKLNNIDIVPQTKDGFKVVNIGVLEISLPLSVNYWIANSSGEKVMLSDNCLMLPKSFRDTFSGIQTFELPEGTYAVHYLGKVITVQIVAGKINYIRN